jgi:uncharacterized protein YsxB (DUF464 family)
MTKVCFYKADKGFTGFEISGHACLSLDEPDVLCAAISGMTMLVVNTLVECFDAEVDFSSDESKPLIRAKLLSCPDKNRDAVNGVIRGFVLQLQDLAGQYPNNLYVEVN